MAIPLQLVNCPDLHYPSSRASVAFLAHLHTFTWIAWILGREFTTRGADSIRHRNPGRRLRPRIMEPRGLVGVAWVGLRNQWASTGRCLAIWSRLHTADRRCCQKHDVVVKLSLPSVCWQEEPPATQDTCRLVAEAQGASRGKLPKTSAFCPLPSTLCSLPSALCPQPSALSPHSGFVPSSKLRCSAWKVVAIV
jgi:hypothetical protein